MKQFRKHFLLVVVVFAILILTACSSATNYKYKINGQYSDKISPEVAAIFIDFSKASIEYSKIISSNGIKEKSDREKVLADGMGKLYDKLSDFVGYTKKQTDNKYDLEVFEVLQGQYFRLLDVQMTKGKFAVESVKDNMGLKTEESL